MEQHKAKKSHGRASEARVRISAALEPGLATQVRWHRGRIGRAMQEKGVLATLQMDAQSSRGGLGRGQWTRAGEEAPGRESMGIPSSVLEVSFLVRALLVSPPETQEWV